MATQKNFIPALRFRWLTPLYDWVVKWTAKEQRFKQKLIEQATLSSNDKVLDVGCGTGSLLVMLGRKQQNFELHGVDIDPKSLAIAERKIKGSGLAVQLQACSVTQLPFEKGYFDRVLCSLMFHHLSDDDKIRTLKEIFRVLKPGGELHFADWGKPSSLWIRWRFLIVQLLDGFTTTNACLSEFVANAMKDSGFVVTQTSRIKSLVGEIELLKARKVE
jgi:ubiquinone/menaquinone biosynthesis C-methylase UbiE